MRHLLFTSIRNEPCRFYVIKMLLVFVLLKKRKKKQSQSVEDSGKFYFDENNVNTFWKSTKVLLSMPEHVRFKMFVPVFHLSPGSKSTCTENSNIMLTLKNIFDLSDRSTSKFGAWTHDIFSVRHQCTNNIAIEVKNHCRMVVNANCPDYITLLVSADIIPLLDTHFRDHYALDKQLSSRMNLDHHSIFTDVPFCGCEETFGSFYIGSLILLQIHFCKSQGFFHSVTSHMNNIIKLTLPSTLLICDSLT